MKVALVTGATGFLGGALARSLRARGWAVSALVRRPGGAADRLEADGVRVLRTDGRSEDVRRAVEEVGPDVVFHLASLFLAQHRPEDVEGLVQANVLLGTQLLDALAGSGGVFVNAGTSWQHDEDGAVRPVNLYAATKEAFEAVLRHFVDAAGVRATSLLIFDTYGPGDERPKLLRLLRRALREGQHLDMSPGEQRLDLVHVDDVVAAFVVAAERHLDGRAEPYERFAVSSGEAWRLRDLVALVEEVSGGRLDIRWGGRPYRPREVMRPWTNGPVLPGWAPRVPLREGLAAYLAEEGDG